MRRLLFAVLFLVPTIMSAQQTHYGTLNITSAGEEQTGGATMAPGFPGTTVMIPSTDWVSRGTMKNENGECRQVVVFRPALKIGVHELFRDNKGNLRVSAFPPEHDKHGKVKTYALKLSAAAVCSPDPQPPGR